MDRLRRLRRALADSDTKALMSVPGIGKRVAERLVVKLRDKVDLPVGAVGQGTDSAGGPLRGQVTEALVGLGFTVAAADIDKDGLADIVVLDIELDAAARRAER